MRTKIVHGKTSVPPSKHEGVDLKNIIGKRVVAVGSTTVESLLNGILM